MSALHIGAKPLPATFLDLLPINHDWFNSIISFQNLLTASRKARRGKRFKTATAQFEFSLEKEIIDIQRQLREQTYHPGSYREFLIYEPKPRKIIAAPYRDRVVQHALCNIIEPIFDRSLIFDTYACRIGKGNHKALDRFTFFSRRFEYALKCDIKKILPLYWPPDTKIQNQEKDKMQ